MRLRAVDAVESGVHPEDVAASLGMARGTVYGWLARYREGGKDALQARPVPGRPPKLTGAQMRRLYTMIVGADPRQYEFEFALWTRDMVRVADPPRVQGVVVGSQRGPTAAHPGAVAAAAAVAGLAGRPRGRAALARGGVPGHPQAGQGRGGDDLLRRRGGHPLGLPRRHHLGAGRADPGGEGHRGPAQPEHDLRGHRARAAAVLPPTPAASPAPGSSSSAASSWPTPTGRSTWSSTATPPTAPSW